MSGGGYNQPQGMGSPGKGGAGAAPGNGPNANAMPMPPANPPGTQVANTYPGVTGGGTPGKGGAGAGASLSDWANNPNIHTALGAAPGNNGGQQDPAGGLGGTPGVTGGGTPGMGGNPMGPNAFETGLNAQNNSMDWFQNAMNYQAPQSGGVGMNDVMGRMKQAQGGGYRAAMANAPGQDLYSYDPATMQGQSYQAAQLSDQDINQYMNPYTQNVIDSTMGDLDMARQNALNNTGVAASRGGAFGGDRHGIMEAQNNNDYMQNVARTSSQLRNQGFQNAQSAAMGDVNAQNQALSSNAAMAQQAGLSNQAAQNARDQFVGQTANQNAMQTALANQNASNAAGAFNAQLGAQTSATNANNQNALLGQLASMAQQNAQFNTSQQNQAFNNQMSAAQGLYGMGQDRFNMGQNALNQMGQVGSEIDDLNQNLINQQIQMFMNQQGAPQSQFQNMLGPLSALSGGGTQNYNPGKMDYLGMGTGLAGAALMSDARLKDNVKKVATINKINLYTWDWNEMGKKVAGDQRPFGVLAQEVRETRPDAVIENADGWLMVDYAKLPEVAKTVMMRA